MDGTHFDVEHDDGATADARRSPRSPSISDPPAIFWGLMALLVWAPVPLASNRPWSWSLLALAAGVLLAAWGAATWRRGELSVSWARLAGPAALFAGFAGWTLFQILPMSGPPAASLWADALLALGRAAPATISLDPDATLDALMRILAYGAVFLLAVQLGQDAKRARLTLWAVAAAGAACAVYGLALETLGSQTILGMPKWAYRADMTATFVNRNAFAAYEGVALLCVAALLMTQHPGGTARATLTSRTGIIEMIERLRPPAFVLALAGAVLALALLGSHSRGGLAAGAAGMLTLIVARLVSRRAAWRTILLVGLAAAAAMAAGLELYGTETLGRFLRPALPGADRADIHALALEAIRAAPVFGHGLGAFPDIFHLYRGEGFSWATDTYDKAHNVFLELAAESGIVGAGLLLGAAAWAVAVCARGLVRRRRGAIYPALALAATALLGLHGLVDFSIQMPAVAVTYAALLGVGYAQSWRSGDGPVRVES